MSFAGKTVLITGASRGMGAATAAAMAEKGARVFTAQRGKAGFEDISVDLSDAAALAKWIQVFDRIQNGEMPPAKKKQPTQSNRTGGRHPLGDAKMNHHPAGSRPHHRAAHRAVHH